MPQPFSNAVITNAGAHLLTRAQAGDCKMEFTRIAVGDGAYSDAEKTLSALQERAELKSLKNSYPVSSIKIHNNRSVKVTALITNYDSMTGQTLVNTGYYINEMGLYAKEQGGEDGTEVLYSIAITIGDSGDFMPPYNGYSPAQIMQDYFATVNNSAEVSIKSGGAIALAEDVEALRKQIEDVLEKMGAGTRLRLQVGGEKPDEGPWIWFDTQTEVQTDSEIVLSLSEGNDGDVQVEVEQKNYNVDNGTTDENQIADGKIFVDVID